MYQSLQGATFHVEHVLPKARGGTSEFTNLAWCCPSCNLHKSDRIEATDPQENQIVSLFNPRLSSWSEHFQWKGYEIIGISPIGRASVLLLDFNHPRRLRIREAEQRLGFALN